MYMSNTNCKQQQITLCIIYQGLLIDYNITSWAYMEFKVTSLLKESWWSQAVAIIFPIHVQKNCRLSEDWHPMSHIVQYKYNY
jgi:hypothetical protein